MKREQVLLKPETIDAIEKEAEKQGISKSAIMRQYIEAIVSNMKNVEIGLDGEDYKHDRFTVKLHVNDKLYSGKIERVI